MSLILTADLNWSFQLKKDGLVNKDVSRLQAQSSDLLFSQVNLLSWAASDSKLRVECFLPSHFQEFVDDMVDINILALVLYHS
jgi:hypothetical protein